MLPFKLPWLNDRYPRYLRPQAVSAEIQCHEQDINHLAFSASPGLQDFLIISDGQARVKVYDVMPSSKRVLCVWQSRGSENASPITSFSRDMGMSQGIFVAVAAQRSIQMQSIATMLMSSGDATHSSITTPLEGCYNIAWDSSGSFVVLCTAIRRLRLYHNSGKVCTEVDSVSDTTIAIFAPGDTTMLYCITPQGVKLRSLRALPECASFCQAVDQISLSAKTGTGALGHVQASNPTRTSPADPTASCWLPSSPAPEPRVAQPNSMHAAQQSRVSDIMGSAPACGCTEECPCTAGCPNMQNSSLIRTPLAIVASTQQQADGKKCSSGASALSVAAAASKEQTPASFQQSFSRRRQHQGTGHKRKADYAWLHGGDDTPCTTNASQDTGFQGALWGALSGAGVASQKDDGPVLSQESEADHSVLPNGVVTWFTADACHERATFDAKAGRYCYNFQGHTSAVSQVLPLSDGHHILTSSSDNSHKLWTMAGQGLCTFRPPASAASGYACTLSPCQQYVVAGHGSSVYVWNIKDVLRDAGDAPAAHSYGNHHLQLQHHECVVTALTVAPCNSMMASADSAGKVVIRFSL